MGTHAFVRIYMLMSHQRAFLIEINTVMVYVDRLCFDSMI
jgi:hypothetical protein